jgi:hypothetical protein
MQDGYGCYAAESAKNSGIAFGAYGHVAVNAGALHMFRFCGWRGADHRLSLVTAIFPEPAVAATEHVEPVGQLDAHQIFRLLVAELPFDPRPQRGTMTGRKRSVVESVHKNGLRMESVDQIDAFVILSGPFKRILIDSCGGRASP